MVVFEVGFDVKPGEEDEFVRAMTDETIADLLGKQRGCQVARLYRSLSAPSQYTTYVIYAEWDSRASWTAVSSSMDWRRLMRAILPLLASPPTETHYQVLRTYTQ